MSTAPTQALPSSRSADVWRRFRRNRLAMVGLVIVLLLAVTALFAPLLAPKDPVEQSLRNRRDPPGKEYLLGADEFGRDILSRIIFGTRASMLISLTSVGFGLLLGTFLGAVAGYAGGTTDTLIMRSMDLLLAFPYLLLAIIIVTALGPGLTNTIIAIGIWTTPAFARITRGAVTSIKERDYIQAARALGAGDPKILRDHVTPNFVAPLLVYASLYLAYAILMESALSFLGLGVQPPQASWAGMIASGRNYITSAPHIATIPGIAIAIAVLGFNLLGDGLRDALDPRLKL
ncbi:MAG: ABC transporter permease [Trueperaceae bacterium]|nr:MAG: ABC transporter permease [Trueperaceae bacterium]